MSEEAARRIVPIYTRHAGAYDTLRSRTLLEAPWLDRFAALLATDGAVLDLGCGMGEPIAADIVRRGFRVTGIDSSPALIEMARERMPKQTWAVADMRALDLGRRFDGILAWDSLFHLTRDSQRAMFPIFAAHAMPGCALMFTSGTLDGEAMGTFEGEPLYHSSLAPEAYRALLAGAGFEVVDFVVEDPACGSHTVWLARRV